MGTEAATARARGQQAPRSPEDLPAEQEDHAGGSRAGEGLGGGTWRRLAGLHMLHSDPRVPPQADRAGSLRGGPAYDPSSSGPPAAPFAPSIPGPPHALICAGPPVARPRPQKRWTCHGRAASNQKNAGRPCWGLQRWAVWAGAAPGHPGGPGNDRSARDSNEARLPRGPPSPVCRISPNLNSTEL